MCKLRVGPSNQLDMTFLKIIYGSFPFRGEEQVAALTAGKRLPWAEARTKYFQAGTNARSLKTIESAAFAVSLDDEEATMGSSGSSRDRKDLEFLP